MLKVDLVREHGPEPRRVKEIVVHGETPAAPVLVFRQMDENPAAVGVFISDDDGDSLVAGDLGREHLGKLMDGIRELMAR